MSIMGLLCPEQLTQEETLEEVCVGPKADVRWPAVERPNPSLFQPNLRCFASGQPQARQVELSMLRIAPMRGARDDYVRERP